MPLIPIAYVDDATKQSPPPSFFDKKIWKQICSTGLQTNLTRLMQAGLVHVQDWMYLTEEDRAAQVRSFLAPLQEVGNRFVLRSVTNDEQRRRLAETLGVAATVEVISQVMRRCGTPTFSRIPPDDKSRGDYFARAANLPILSLEAKGGQDVAPGLIRQACRQLDRYHPPKYAIGIKTVYDGEHPLKLYIGDPDIESPISSHFDALVDRMQHFVRLLVWAGFYQFAERLAYRLGQIRNAGPLGYERFDGASLRQELVSKVGGQWETTVQANNVRVRGVAHLGPSYNDPWIPVQKGTDVLFLVSTRLYQVLRDQHFHSILRFNEPELVSTGRVRQYVRQVSARWDGAIWVLRTQSSEGPVFEIDNPGFRY
jgi:hypothetical protein